MWARISVLCFVASLALGADLPANTTAQEAAVPQPPAWAYPVNPPDFRPPADDGTQYRVPGSSKTMTRSQALDRYNVPDWHPAEHPVMPPSVKSGRKDDKLWGCGYCHLPTGLGRPENANLAGMPVSYAMEQMRNFKNGLRKSAEPRSSASPMMVDQAKLSTEAEWEEAARYFASLKPKPWVRVIETDTVPKTHVWSFMYVVTEGAGTEPIGQRIVEVAEDYERAELRDTNSGFIAYVPTGSVEKGRVLVATGGGGKTIQCAACHGADLKGLGHVPAIAGRSPSYLFRQMYDFKWGFRRGPSSGFMKESVAKLSDDEMLSISAYLASLAP